MSRFTASLAQLRSHASSVGPEGPFSSAECLWVNRGVVCIWLREAKNFISVGINGVTLSSVYLESYLHPCKDIFWEVMFERHRCSHRGSLRGRVSVLAKGLLGQFCSSWPFPAWLLGPHRAVGGSHGIQPPPLVRQLLLILSTQGPLQVPEATGCATCTLLE